MEQLQSILTDLDNKEITKHQAYHLILVLFEGDNKDAEICQCDWNNQFKTFATKEMVCAKCKKPLAK